LKKHGSNTTDLAREKANPSLRATFDDMLDRLDDMMPLASQIPRYVPDVRLKCETSVINVLAGRLIALLRKRDPLSDNVKLGKVSVLGATLSGVTRAWI
jgi:hypothetical protein